MHKTAQSFPGTNYWLLRKCIGSQRLRIEQPSNYPMASIIQIPESGNFRAQVRRTGFKTKTKTFTTFKLAEGWAKRIEDAIETSISTGTPLQTDNTVADAVARYRKEVGESNPIGRTKEYVLRQIEQRNDGLGGIKVCNLTAANVVHYITKQRNISGVTANIEVYALNSVLEIARILFEWPMREGVMCQARKTLVHMKRIGVSKKCDRRPTLDELSRLREWFGLHSKSLTPDIFDFILDSCFRPPSEITRLRWEDLNVEDRTILIRDRKDPREKIGNDQVVPLRGRCLEIILRQDRVNEFIFPVNGKTWSTIFPRACNELGIKGLRLYDLRHEAISRMVESSGWNLFKMMLVSGHKDPKTMKRYSHLRGADFVNW
jgi:integrase